jgi:hypothetical protein
LGQSRSKIRRSLGDAGGGRAISKRTGPAGSFTDTPERQRQQLEFYIALGAALMLAKGFAALETGQVYARARELWEQLDSPAEFL